MEVETAARLVDGAADAGIPVVDTAGSAEADQADADASPPAG